MTQDELAERLLHACMEVIAAEDELTELDSAFGDADHGATMTKVASAISASVCGASGGIQEMLEDAATAVAMLSGSRAMPLWGAWLDGLQEDAPKGPEATVDDLKSMFARALDELSGKSGAKAGDKTMMDALIPASEAIASCAGDELDLFDEAAEAAEKGAEATKGLAAKLGRAKGFGEKTIGTPDAGAVSMARFFKGLAEA